MAKGKHAARAQRRANDAAISHIDRLAEQVAEAKYIAKTHKYAALRVPALEEEISSLRQQVQDVCSAEVRSLRQEVIDVREEYEDRMIELAVIFFEAICFNKMRLHPYQFSHMSRLIGRDTFSMLMQTAGKTNRAARRNFSISPQRLETFINVMSEYEEFTPKQHRQIYDRMHPSEVEEPA